MTAAQVSMTPRRFVLQNMDLCLGWVDSGLFSTIKLLGAKCGLERIDPHECHQIALRERDKKKEAVTQ